MTSLHDLFHHSNHTTFDEPTFNYTTSADQRLGKLLPQWAAVCTLLLLFALAQLIKYIAIVIPHVFPRVIRHGYGPISGVIAEQGRVGGLPKLGTTTAGGRTLPEGLPRGDSASSSTIIPLEEEEEEEDASAQGISAPPEQGEEGGERLLESHGTWHTRIDRASDALRTNLLLLLATSTLISLPIEYCCATRIGRLEDLAMGCGPCLANSTSSTTTILTWLFVAATVVGALLELLVADPRSSSVIRFALILVAQPLMVMVFVLAFARWNFLKGLSCKAPAPHGKYDAIKLDMLDLLVQGSSLI